MDRLRSQCAWFAEKWNPLPHNSSVIQHVIQKLYQLCYNSSLLLNSKKTNLLTCLIMWWRSMKETRQRHFKYFDKVTEFLSNSYQKIVINEILLCLSQCPLIPGNPTNERFITIQNGCKSSTVPTAVCLNTVGDTNHPQSHIAWFQAPNMKEMKT